MLFALLWVGVGCLVSCVVWNIISFKKVYLKTGFCICNRSFVNLYIYVCICKLSLQTCALKFVSVSLVL